MKILITGGASGLGGAITRRLASEPGNEIFFTYCNSKDQAQALEREFRNAVALKCDFKNPDELEALKQGLGKLDIDVLVNNAYSGSFINAHFHKIAPAEFESDFRANVLPTIAVTQAAISRFREKKAGRIITILSSALIGAPPAGASIYAANKAYLHELTKVWAAENARFNIVSNSVSPSFMQTPFTAGIDERMVEMMRSQHPLKQLLRTDEVADTVSFLCTSTTHLNGVDIAINAATSVR